MKKIVVLSGAAALIAVSLAFASSPLHSAQKDRAASGPPGKTTGAPPSARTPARPPGKGGPAVTPGGKGTGTTARQVWKISCGNRCTTAWEACVYDSTKNIESCNRKSEACHSRCRSSGGGSRQAN